jgi:predicted RNA-binding protein YlqC (UPF0109 family)
MKQLIEVIAKALVDYPEDVHVETKHDRNNVIYKLSVNPDDVGKVIGKHGRIAKALRTVVISAGSKNEERIMIDILS